MATFCCARHAALAKIADDRLPALRAVWDACVADLSTLGRLYYTSADAFYYFIGSQKTRILNGSLDLVTWSPVTAIRKHLLGGSDIEQRKALLQRVVDASVPAGTPRSPILLLLQAYQVWAKTAVWDSPTMDLNKRMKQFIRQCGWIYFPALPPPAPAPSAPPAPVAPVAPAPSAPPAPVEDPEEEEYWPIEPMAEPIVGV